MTNRNYFQDRVNVALCTFLAFYQTMVDNCRVPMDPAYAGLHQRQRSQIREENQKYFSARQNQQFERKLFAVKFHRRGV